MVRYQTKFLGGGFVCVMEAKVCSDSQPVSELFHTVHIFFDFVLVFSFSYLALLGIGPEPGGPA